MNVKFQKNNTNKFILGVVDLVFFTEGQKSINQLLMTAPDSALFCQRLEHLLVSWIFSSILSPLTVDEILVHNSLSFADEVSRFCPDHIMTSLDVETLFTNIPLNEVIDICIDDLFCDTNTLNNLDCSDIRELLWVIFHHL